MKFLTHCSFIPVLMSACKSKESDVTHDTSVLMALKRYFSKTRECMPHYFVHYITLALLHMDRNSGITELRESIVGHKRPLAIIGNFEF